MSGLRVESATCGWSSTGSSPSAAWTSTCRPGDLRFLIGPNGAGKTTLVDAVTGLVEGHRLGHASASTSCSAARCTGSPGWASAAPSRPPTVFEELTVLQNLDIAAGCRAAAR